ncbi:hypothetical protein CHX26_09695 [Porphyrobacter sp. HT-58-2]|uniref:ATP-binding protein n=1 Tax=Porphyrobacter sp. HT-58-2 TaxID=2023229 RepID=UPI000CDC0D03|nr:cyanophycin synthetase [Porphyrobacter sp. HT-58-2]AUX69736.1 hypothetical protein CHX26_09695 [Porphyrobacter sp. HT-58-2]
MPDFGISDGWHLTAPVQAVTGFAHGSAYPSLLCALAGSALPASSRAAAGERIAALLPPHDPPLPPTGMDDGHGATLAWLLAQIDLCQAAAGLPVCEPARVLEDGAEAARCQIPSLGRSLGPLSVLLQCLLALLPALIEGQRDPALEAEFTRLHGVLAKTNFRSSNVPRFVRAAHALGLPLRELPGQFLLLGEGAHSRWLDSTFTDATPFIATQLARSKLLSAAHLRDAGLPVPQHRLVASASDAQAAAAALGYPVVVKPANLDGGTGVAAGLQHEDEVVRAYDTARRHSPEIMVEKHIAGRDYRLTVFQDRLVWAVERVPAGVTGDGTHSIAELVAAANADPRRGSGDHAALKRLVLDAEAETLLAQTGMSATDVPEAGRFVRLRRAANVASGGMPVAVFDKVHPDNAQLAVRAAAALRLDLAGVDLIIPDIARSWREGGAAICEVNAQPQLGGTTSAHVYPQILKALVPGEGRIPCIILAGFAEDSPLAEDIAARLSAQGLRAGCHDQRGVRLAGEWLCDGPRGLLEAGQMLAGHRGCDAMVLTLPGGETLANGLPVSRYDVLAIGPETISPPAAALLRAGQPDRIITAQDNASLASIIDQAEADIRSLQPRIASLP